MEKARPTAAVLPPMIGRVLPEATANAAPPLPEKLMPPEAVRFRAVNADCTSV